LLTRIEVEFGRASYLHAVQRFYATFIRTDQQRYAEVATLSYTSSTMTT
jgi:hypothetical protein